MASRRVKIGIVGCGWVALTDYFPALGGDHLKDRVEFVAVCDIALDRAREVAAKYGAKEAWGDYDEMLAKTEAEAIVLLTPIPLHFAQGVKAIEAGKQLYIQKTMTTTYAEASELIERAGRKGVTLCASPGQLLDPGHRAAKEVLASGKVGRVQFARGQGSHPGHENVDTFGIDPTWYYRPGGGPVMDVAVYPLHSLTGIIGPVRRVTAFSGVANRNRTYRGQPIDIQMDDSTLMLLDFGNSVFAEVNGTYCQVARDTPQVEVYCTGGVLHVGGWARPSVPLEVFATIDGPGGAKGWYRPNGLAPLMKHTVADLAHFADCVADGLTPVHSAAQAAHVIEVIEKGYLAARTGQARDVMSTF
ncbi:MAG: Gfo/Idh/MocA family oxidoreductase [Chloroflexota bacterium]|nr:MAG: Gfo/Idh/MocA family oxidoreductase [Chloroflexota bacterium]